jgi:hypothetical protein
MPETEIRCTIFGKVCMCVPWGNGQKPRIPALAGDNGGDGIPVPLYKTHDQSWSE